MGATRRLEREHDERVWLAWNTAALIKSQRKHMPDIKRMYVSGRNQPKKRQSWQQQFEIMERWAAVSRRRVKPRRNPNA